jgi:hypothetical protein
VHGGTEQIHLEVRRTGPPLLQTTQASREVRVDSRGGSSPCPAQGLPIKATDPHGPSQGRAAAALPRCDYSRGQYCHRCRAAGRRPRLPGPASSLLRQRGSIRVQGPLSARAEASVRSTHHLAEATTLLPAVLGLRRHRLPAWRYPAEPRCHWNNL